MINHRTRGRQEFDRNRARLRAAFATLRGMGYLARRRFSCCIGCAGEELGALAAKRVAEGGTVRGGVFYTRQDDDLATENGKPFLSFGQFHYYEADGGRTLVGIDTTAAGAEIVTALRAQGLSPEWNGKGDSRIVVPLIATAGGAGAAS